VADIEGYPDVGGLFRDTSEAETGHAFRPSRFFERVGDPVTDVPIGSTEKNLKSAVEGETLRNIPRCIPGSPGQRAMRDTRNLAEWFRNSGQSRKSHAGRFSKGLEKIAGREPADAAS